jgi:two-component system KDP operon response regulator KdpE
MLSFDMPHTDVCRVVLSGTTPVPDAIARACARHGLELDLAGNVPLKSVDADALVIRADAVWFAAVELAAQVVQHSEQPVLLWAREPSAACRVAAYEKGVADVFAATIDATEFAIRVRAAVSRATRRLVPTRLVLATHTGFLTVTPSRRHAVGPDGPVHLTALQWRLFGHLIAHQGIVQPHDALVRAVWDGVADTAARHTLRTHVSVLRKLLDLPIQVLGTVHGYGYVLHASDGDTVGL